MNFSKYQNTLPYPKLPPAPKPPTQESSYEEALEYAEAVKVYEAESKIWREAQEKYHSKSRELNAQFKYDALMEVGLAGHPKADKVFAKAWERGHANGYQEVFHILEDLAELVL